MDTPNLLIPAALVLILVFVPRILMQSVGRASDGIAQLFVPPDRALGWPRGVQESDEPWAWREPAAGSRDATTAEPPVPDLVELIDVSFERAAVRDALIVKVRAVQPRRRA
jgi:hypothetical protein